MAGPEYTSGCGYDEGSPTDLTRGKDRGIDLNLAEGGKEGICPRLQRGNNPVTAPEPNRPGPEESGPLTQGFSVPF